MTVIARDQVAADHLVYPWPLPIGVECEVACGDDDIVVMCPAWLVGDQLGPGRHHWRTPDPSRPTGVYFVRQAPVEVPFDMATTFLLPAPTAGAPPPRVRLLASGAVQISCADPSLLVAQFVGLPFDAVNDGILRSVSRSVERMLARLLTRRVVVAATSAVVTEPAMLPHILEELVAYNPAAGAVFGIELMGVVRLTVGADDGVAPSRGHHQTAEWGRVGRGSGEVVSGSIALPRGDDGETTAPDAALNPAGQPAGQPADPAASHSQTIRHAAVPAPGSTPPVGVRMIETTTPPFGVPPNAVVSASGEIVLRSSGLALPLIPPLQQARSTPTLSGVAPIPAPPHRPTPPEGAVPNPATEATTPPSRPSPRPPTPIGHAAVDAALVEAIERQQASGEFAMKVPPGTQVKVAGPDGMMQSATVRQLLQGYYELEVSSGETIWVPAAGVVPE